MEPFASVDVAFALASPDDAAATRARREGFARRPSDAAAAAASARRANPRRSSDEHRVAVARATPPGTRIDDTPRSGSVATIARRSRAGVGARRAAEGRL